MKLGIALLVIGVILLFAAIPISILGIASGVMQSTQGVLSGGVIAYLGVAGVVAGLIMTAIGAIKVFKP
jgi:hypothetical protein